jgi:hypothetical protein
MIPAVVMFSCCRMFWISLHLPLTSAMHLSQSVT